MKVPLYILGFLIKHGPQHGYKLKQVITEEVSRFAQIKQPTIYYHLERMAKNGLVTFKAEQEGNRPERSVYRITRKGRTSFLEHLNNALKKRYVPEFILDAPLYFLKSLDTNKTIDALEKHAKTIDGMISEFLLYSTEVLLSLEGIDATMMRSILNHHIYHYQVELKWAHETIKYLEKIREDEKEEEIEQSI
ncbi:MAG: PadR family transcriptional regulator [Bacteroidia bacterium]|nr:MAG: PadR family transcriptional regulator [Bacteroidia bacterium]